MAQNDVFALKMGVLRKSLLHAAGVPTFHSRVRLAYYAPLPR